MDVGTVILERRLAVGLTQVELAHRASISLSTLQKIEAGRVSPRWDNVSSILESLGLELHFPEQKLDLDVLVKIGVPLSGQANFEFLKDLGVRKRDEVIGYIVKVLQKVLINESSLDGRVLEALSAYLFSIKTYYPSAYRGLIRQLPGLTALTPTDKGSPEAKGRLIKLSRLVKSQLSQIF